MISSYLVQLLVLKELLLQRHLQLSDDDVYSMTISDGTQSYTASNLIVDIMIQQVQIILETRLQSALGFGY